MLRRRDARALGEARRRKDKARKLVAAAGASHQPGGDGDLATESVLILRGKWRHSLEILDGRGEVIGRALRSAAPSGAPNKEPPRYIFSDAEDRFELQFPVSKPRATWKEIRRPPSTRDPDRSFKLRALDRDEDCSFSFLDEWTFESEGETIAGVTPCIGDERRVARVSHWSGSDEWRIATPSDVEFARVVFLRQRNLRYVANAFLFAALGDRVCYVVTISPEADALQRAAAIAYSVIADNFFTDFIHAGDD